MKGGEVGMANRNDVRIKSNEGRKYYNEIDCIKAITVIFVVLGHSFPDFENGMRYKLALFISRYCYSFHMGLFFMVSGFLVYRKFVSTDIDMAKEIKKKIFRLMVPYLLYSFITFVIKIKLNAYANHAIDSNSIWKIFLGESPNGSLWFLWTLFFIWLFVLLYSRFSKKIYPLVIIGVGLYVLTLFDSIGVMKNLCRYFSFYCIGLLIAHRYEDIKTILTMKWFPVIALIIVGIFALAQTTGIIGEQFYLISGLFGSYGIWAISYRERKENRIIKLLSYYSYDIYLLSYFPQIFIRTLFDRIFDLNYIFTVVFMFLGGLILPVAVSKFCLRRHMVLRKLFLGDVS